MTVAFNLVFYDDGDIGIRREEYIKIKGYYNRVCRGDNFLSVNVLAKDHNQAMRIAEELIAQYKEKEANKQ